MACFYLYHMILFHQNFMYLDSNNTESKKKKKTTTELTLFSFAS